MATTPYLWWPHQQVQYTSLNLYLWTVLPALCGSPLTSDYDFSEVSFFVSLCFRIFLYFCAMHCSLAVWQPCDKRQWLRCGLRQWLQWLQCGPPRQIETCASEWPMAFGHCCCWGETDYSTASPCFLLQLLLLPIFFSNCPPPALSGVALNVLQHSF